MEKHQILEIVDFDNARPVTKILHNSNTLRLALFCLQAGQTIAPHTSPSQVAFYTIQGQGEITVGKERIPAKTGSLITASPQEPHGLRAHEPMVVLAAIAPAPD
ncbi:MAG: cupin domain-containing protein [Chloroflexi bacterium]|nr:cupin domain-containing protein [Chloroflexota bacterium]